MIINQLRVTGTSTAFYEEGESQLKVTWVYERNRRARTKMSLLILFGVLLHCCAFGISDEHETLVDNHVSGATNVMNVPLTPSPENVRQFQRNYPFPSLGYKLQRCPLCDSSIYPYCGEKLFHDACCCTDPYDLPYQCKLADCRFLHANSCREHSLIANCCCNDDYRTLLKSLAQK
ncbi:hypothetical protein ALC60_11856 [Trachymyrmex zeteki]|uniref:CCC domain-containing protein n=2 Tax=Mycetomoellerius zeteki TaxID=64791 RepID=A0A151WMK7_9HYME|nr:hypothetical protein ALC60_11856 [Trachymyrmex zeteki]